MTQTELKERLNEKVAAVAIDGPRFTILRSRLAYRMTGDVFTNGYDKRVQDMLKFSDINEYIGIENAIVEKYNPLDRVYERTNRSIMEDKENVMLQIGRIDAIYPHQITTDATLAAAAKENRELITVDFPLLGIYGHVKGNILIPKRDESETDEDVFRRTVKYLNSQRFVAVQDVENADLANRLGINGKIDTVIVPIWKMPVVRILD